MKKCVVLVSGGLDSATLLLLANSQGWETHAISFEYGQKHKIELEKAKLVAKEAASHKIIKLDSSIFTRSSLVGEEAVAEFVDIRNVPNEVADTYVPGRNLLFLSYAASYAENIGAGRIFIGVHGSDSANYPDCRPEFIQSLSSTLKVALAASVSIEAPFVKLKKAEVVKIGLELGVDYSKTISCYQPNEIGASCGKCLACLGRLQAFAANDSQDPAQYY